MRCDCGGGALDVVLLVVLIALAYASCEAVDRGVVVETMAHEAGETVTVRLGEKHGE